jgi:hypothetical protein
MKRKGLDSYVKEYAKGVHLCTIGEVENAASSVKGGRRRRTVRNRRMSMKKGSMKKNKKGGKKSMKKGGKRRKTHRKY